MLDRTTKESTLMLKSISEIILERRTINRFLPDSAPPRDVVIRALEHAVYAPNHYLTQPWRFYLLGPESRTKIRDLNAELVNKKKGEKAAAVVSRIWEQVPGWLLMTSQRANDEVQELEEYAACCCAAQNLMLYLWEKGIGVKWNTGKVARHARFLSMLGIDADKEKTVGLFWYGVPDEHPRTTRKPIDSVVTNLS